MRIGVVLSTLALLAGAATVSWLQPTEPTGFYTATDGFEDREPGALLRS